MISSMIAVRADEIRVWVPDDVRVVRGFILHQSGFGQYNNKWEDPRYREFARLHRFGTISTDFNVADKKQFFMQQLSAWGTANGHPEVMNSVFATSGMSAGGGAARKVATKWAERTVCAVPVCISGGPPEDTGAMHTPVAQIAGENDFLEMTVWPGYGGRSQGAQWCAAIKPGNHTFGNAGLFMYAYWDQCIRERVPSDWDPETGECPLIRLSEDDGAIGFRDIAYTQEKTGRIVEKKTYTGSEYNSTWFPNLFTAHLWRGYRARETDLSILSPWAGNNPDFHEAGGSVQFTVNATGKVGSATKLIMYDGDVPLSTIENPSTGVHSVAVGNLAPGIHVFNAVAVTSDGEKISSFIAPYGVKATDTDIRIASHRSGDRVEVGSTTAVSIWADARSGAIEEVELFLNGESLGKTTESPYTLVWTPGSVGEKILTAKVTNSSGTTTWSMPVRLVANETSVPDYIHLHQKSAVVRPGETFVFSADIRDQYNIKVENPASIAWAVTGGGTIDQNGVFTAGETLGDFKVTASAAGLSAEAPVTVTKTYRFNFQAPGADAPDGFIADEGIRFGEKEHGYKYGWFRLKDGKVREYEVRNSLHRPAHESVPMEYATFLAMHQQYAPPWNKSWQTYWWQMLVPNGEYDIRIVAGDPDNRYINQHSSGREGAWAPDEHHYRIKVEDEIVVDGKPGATHTWDAVFENGRPAEPSPWVEGTATVQVTDDTLTITNAEGQSLNKICFVEFAPKGYLVPTRLQTPGEVQSVRPGVSLIGNRITVSNLKSRSRAKVVIYDAVGRCVLNAPVDYHRPGLSISGLAPGMYHASLVVDRSTVARASVMFLRR